MKYYLVRTRDAFREERRLDKVLSALKNNDDGVYFHEISSKDFEELGEKGDLRGNRFLFAIYVDDGGMNENTLDLIRFLRTNRDCMKEATGGVIVDGRGDLFTKDTARKLVLAANTAGCTFPGKCLCEARGDLGNFKVLAQTGNMTPEDTYISVAKDLVSRVWNFKSCCPEVPKILMLHASSRSTSNSLMLWEMVSSDFENKASVEEISLRNGQVWDCRGCKYEDCLHFGETSGCFYGGVMAEKVYPAILRCDVLVLVCPNYNDAVSANITAFINRLTALFRTNDFSSKRVYALIVSGYSGGDIIAEQIIGSMNMNKNFILPGNFAILATANEPGSVLECKGIEEKAKNFGKSILNGPLFLT